MTALQRGREKSYLKKKISKVFIGLLPSKGCPTFAALIPQDFSVIDLRHHFAIHSHGDVGLWDRLHGVLLLRASPGSKSSPSSRGSGSNLSSSWTLMFSRISDSWAWCCSLPASVIALIPAAAGSH